jgi:hypothetical protein
MAKKVSTTGKNAIKQPSKKGQTRPDEAVILAPVVEPVATPSPVVSGAPVVQAAVPAPALAASKSKIPTGSKICLKGAQYVVELADGSVVSLAEWLGVAEDTLNASNVASLVAGKHPAAAQDLAPGVRESIAADALAAPVCDVPGAVAADGSGFNPLYLAPLGLLAIAAAASGGGGGGGGNDPGVPAVGGSAQKNALGRIASFADDNGG